MVQGISAKTIGFACVAMTCAYQGIKTVSDRSFIKNLPEHLERLEREIIEAQALGTFAQRQYQLAEKYNKCRSFMLQLPESQIQMHAPALNNIYRLHNCPIELRGHIFELWDLVELFKKHPQFETVKQVLLDGFRHLNTIAAVLAKRKKLDPLDFDLLQSLYQKLSATPAPTPAPAATECPYAKLVCDAEAEELTRDIVGTLGSCEPTYGAFLTLLRNAWVLYKKGDRLKEKNIHGLKFIELLFNDANKADMKKIYENRHVKSKFVPGIKEGLDKRTDVMQLMPGFAARMKVNQSDIKPFFENRDWDALLKFLIYR
jgi:hypothetical protein